MKGFFYCLHTRDWAITWLIELANELQIGSRTVHAEDVGIVRFRRMMGAFSCIGSLCGAGGLVILAVYCDCGRMLPHAKDLRRLPRRGR